MLEIHHVNTLVAHKNRSPADYKTGALGETGGCMCKCLCECMTCISWCDVIMCVGHMNLKKM